MAIAMKCRTVGIKTTIGTSLGRFRTANFDIYLPPGWHATTMDIWVAFHRGAVLNSGLIPSHLPCPRVATISPTTLGNATRAFSMPCPSCDVMQGRPVRVATVPGSPGVYQVDMYCATCAHRWQQ